MRYPEEHCNLTGGRNPICFQKLRIDILIAFRDYGFVDHVELIPPSQLLRVNVTIAISVRLPPFSRAVTEHLKSAQTDAF
jgi:hypothetical protein